VSIDFDPKFYAEILEKVKVRNSQTTSTLGVYLLDLRFFVRIFIHKNVVTIYI